MHKIELYTDGACSGNPGPGGWGVVLICGDYRKEFSGNMPDTTNNQMELTAVIEGLRVVKQPSEVIIYSDSAYVINAFIQGWLEDWQKRGWVKKDNKPVMNRELWEELIALTKTHKASFVKVKGHADNALNNRCDELARAAINKIRG